MDIGQRINKLRIEKKLSMRELGEKVGVSHAHISKLESGINSPSVDLLEKLAEFFNIDISYFFAKDDEGFTQSERNILYARDLTIESLKKDFNLEIDDKPATNEEIEEMIKYIRFLRHQQKERS